MKKEQIYDNSLNYEKKWFKPFLLVGFWIFLSVPLLAQNPLSFDKAIGFKTNTVPVADYEIQNEAGNPQTVFCPDDEIFIDASASANYTRWFLAIFQYNLGGYASGENPVGFEYCRKQPSWTTGQVGQVHLNTIWDACGHGNTFPSGYEYRIQLAVQPQTGGWYVKEDELFVIEENCCEGIPIGIEENCDATFTLVPINNPYIPIKYITEIENPTNNPNATSTWSLFSNPAGIPNPPYTLVRTTESPQLVIFKQETLLDDCFTVLHTIETPCQTCCYSLKVCFDSHPIFVKCDLVKKPKSNDHFSGIAQERNLESDDFSNDLAVDVNQIKVYPTPAIDWVNFEVASSKVDEITSIRIYNLNHQVVQTIDDYSLNGDSISGQWIPNDSDGNGLYIIEIVIKDLVLTQKVLLMR